MERKEFSIARFLSSKSRFDNIVLLEGFIVGILAGIVGVVYRLLLSYGEKMAYFVVDYIKNNILHLCISIICVLIIGFIISKLLKYESYISGSGIPQVEAEMIDQIDEKWYKVILAKMVAGTLSIVGGLSLGREGPSIQLGAMVGKGLASVFKRMKLEEKYLLTCGAAAGLSAAFNAPLAGVLFALEEIHKNFSPLALVTVMVASLTGDFISKNIFGMTPSLYFPLADTLPLGQYGFLIILGIIVGVLGVIYNKTTMFTLKLYDKITFLKNNQKIYIPLLISVAFMIFYPDVLCGGHHIIDILHEGNFVLSTILLLLLMKFIFSLISFGSGTPGGIFFPLLVLGSLIGCAYALIVTTYCGVPQMYFNNFIVVAMAGLFASIVRAPITGIVLIAEMCGSLSQFLPIAVCSFVGYVVANMMKCEPIYHSLLNRMIKNGNHEISLEEKEILHYSVELGSCCLDLPIKELGLPKECIIISINRGIEEIVPRGDTILHLGDHLTILVNKENREVTKDILHKFFTLEI